jgi:drug/metabolite transporter (DMT)-like permease
MQSLATVGVRALGAYLVVSQMSLFAIMLATQLSLEDRVVVPLASPASFAVIGIAMIVWSKRLAGLLAFGLEAPTTSALSAQQLLQVGTALLALSILASAASSIASATWDYFRSELSENDAVAEMRRQRMVANIVGGATSLVIGSLLLWMSRSLWSRSKSEA